MTMSYMVSSPHYDVAAFLDTSRFGQTGQIDLVHVTCAPKMKAFPPYTSENMPRRAESGDNCTANVRGT